MSLSNSVLSRLEYQHKSIAEITANFSDEQLKTRTNPDKWSAFENIVHLCSCQPTFLLRVEKMLSEETPTFERYVAENDPHFYECLEFSREQLISKIERDRDFLFDKLINLNTEELRRRGNHPKYGKLSIAQWSDFFLLHEAHHLWTMTLILFSL